jgi:hypothetical protein
VNGFIEWLLGFTSGEFAGADGWRLGWLAQFGGFVKLLLVVVFGVLVAVTVRSYRREGEAPRRVKAILASLRIAVIVLAFLVLLRPAIVLRFVRELRSQVVVLVDDSLSMSLTDRYLDVERRDAMAEWLGVSVDELAMMPRRELVARAFEQESGVLDYLAEDHPLMFMAFSTNQSDEAYTRLLSQFDASVRPQIEGEDGTPIDPTTLVVVPEFPGVTEIAADAMAELQAGGYETDLARAIRDVLERTRGQRLASIVLLTDGRQTRLGTAERLEAVLTLANERAVPVHAILVGDDSPRKNLSMVSFDGPDQVRSGAEVEMTARVAHRNMAGESVVVNLMSREEGTEAWVVTEHTEVLEIPEVELDPGQEDAGVAEVMFRFEPSQMGRFEYSAEVMPHGQEQDLDDNRSAAMAMDVIDEKINVLLIGGSPTWEFQYLRNFLSRSSDLYRVSVWQQNADADVNQTASTGMKLTHLPRSMPELIGVPDDDERPGYEVVILIDPQPTDEGFDEEFTNLLYDYVVTHGGGLCYVAGPKYSDSMLINSSSFGKLAAMLPVTLASNTATEVARIREERPLAWPVALTSYGREHPIMRLDNTRDGTEHVWSILPGMYWEHPVYQIKPGARVLAEHSNPLRRTGRNAPEPAIAIQSPGVGNSVYVGFNGTWRWRAVRDGYYHRRFWSNTIRFLASGEAAKRVTFSLGADRFIAGEPIRVEAEVFDTDFLPLDSETDTYRIAVIDVDRDETIMIDLEEDEPGRFSGLIGPEHTHRTGRFRLMVPLATDAEREQIGEREFRIELPRAEMLRKEADRATLLQIGRRSSGAGDEGNFLPLEQFGQLADRIAPNRLNTVHERPVELWDSKLMLMLIVLLLTIEWTLRKRYHMA